MKSFSRLLILLLLFYDITLSQNFVIKGTVQEKESGQPLAFTNIRVAGSTMGTSANKNGEFEMRLPQGSYILIASFIGYISDTVSINVNKDVEGIIFKLGQTNVSLQEIVVLPGENPALAIIRKAIERKKERNSKIKSYEFEAYTKGLVRTDEDIEAGSNTISVGVGDKDSAVMNIAGIMENQSKGFFKAPNEYKEIITARKQSANFPPSLNVLTGGRIIRNFYEEDINFLNKNLPGPIADNALEYYYYFIEKQVAINNTPVYQIHIEPDNSTDPGFMGSIFITDSTYDLISVDLELNRAANTGGVFDTVNIFQQFSLYDDSIYMPVDYRMVVSANILGLIHIGFELYSILYDYKINPSFDEEFFDKAVVRVLPEADKKDSLYWLSSQTIPNTSEEHIAYKRIDSVTNAPQTFWDRFSPFSPRINWSDKFSTSSPISVYHFNRVEGHSLDLGLFFDNLADNRLNTYFNFSYGFADKKFKKWFNGSYKFGEYRTTEIKLHVYDRLNILFGDSDNYNELMATVLALFSKYEFRDYYYSNGADIQLSTEVLPVLQLRGGFLNKTDNNAMVNTEYSFFEKDKKFVDNPVINETRINALSVGFKLDFRNYIEDGLYRRRINQGKSNIIFEGDVTFSDKDFFNSSLNFTRYQLWSYGTVRTFRSARFDFRIFSQYTNGVQPYQMLFALPGNVDYTAQHYTFRTLDVNEYIGQNIVTLHLEHDWADELFRLSNIPFIRSSELMLNTYLNIAYSDVNDETKEYIPAEVKTFKKPFFEAGFTIGHVLFPIQIDFGWKLNHRGYNNFRVGINSFIFQEM